LLRSFLLRCDVDIHIHIDIDEDRALHEPAREVRWRMSQSLRHLQRRRDQLQLPGWADCVNRGDLVNRRNELAHRLVSGSVSGHDQVKTMLENFG
jgi:hypothetical protein